MSEVMKISSFELIKKGFEELVGKEVFRKECSFASQIFNGNSYLNKCSMTSKLESVMNVANTGLTLNPMLKYAYLVPRGGKCCLEPSYQGLVKLVTDTGSAKSVTAKIVYQGDDFDYEEGTEVMIYHKPKFQSEEIHLVYAVATLMDGSKQVEVMTIKQIHAIRDRSESYKAHVNNGRSCIWVDHEGEMCRKTVLRRLVKYLPKTDVWNKLGHAIKLDESDYLASNETITIIEQLAETAELPEAERLELVEDLHNLSSDDGRARIRYLKDNQLSHINAGLSVGKEDIQKELNLKQ